MSVQKATFWDTMYRYGKVNFLLTRGHSFFFRCPSEFNNPDYWVLPIFVFFIISGIFGNILVCLAISINRYQIYRGHFREGILFHSTENIFNFLQNSPSISSNQKCKYAQLLGFKILFYKSFQETYFISLKNEMFLFQGVTKHDKLFSDVFGSS